jgi:hypothetical protein
VNRALRAFVFIFIAACASSCSENTPPPPPPRRPVVQPAAPKPPPAPRAVAPTLEDKIVSQQALEKSSPQSFRRIQEGWTAILSEAKGTPYEAKIRDRLDRIDSESNKAYRELFRPVRAEVRELLGARRPDEARRKLEAWTVPPEFDFKGLKTQELRKEQELAAELCGLDALRRRLLRTYVSGDVSSNPRAELSGPLSSPRVYVRAEAESALSEVRRVRSMQTARLRLARIPAQPSEGRRLFGEIPGTPVPTEKLLAGTRPGGTGELHAAVRACVEAMAASPSLEVFEAKLKEGMAILDKDIRAAEWFPVTWYMRAEWRYAFLGDTMGALTDLDQAVVNQRNFVEARMARALLLLQLPMAEQAAKELRALSRALPKPAQESAARALARTKENDFTGAAREIEQAMRTMPDDLAFLHRDAERPRPAAPGWAGDVREESPHYLIRLELPKDAKDREARQTAVQGFAAHLEAARAWFPTLISGSPPPSKRTEVLVFSDEEAYHDYADNDPLAQMNETAGIFLHDRHQIVLHQAWSPEFTLETLVHEAMHEYVSAVGAQVPTWLNEGIADYAAGILVKDGRVVESGRVLSGQLDELKSAIREGWAGMPFGTMLKEDQKEFYGVMRSLQYRQAWSMVHFFRHSAVGKYAALFDLYLREVAKGVPPAKAFTLAFSGRDLETLQHEWLDYVRELR